MNEINDIPLGGTSLPISFFTDYAPDIGVEILVSLRDNYPYLALSTPSVVFESAMNTNTFEVFERLTG